GADSHPHQHVAAKALHQSHAFVRLRSAHRLRRIADRSTGKLPNDLVDQRHALLNLMDADPEPSVHIAVLAHRHFELQPIVRRIAWRSSRIEGAAGRATDVATTAVLTREC